MISAYGCIHRDGQRGSGRGEHSGRYCRSKIQGLAVNPLLSVEPKNELEQIIASTSDNIRTRENT